jgi:hypothetical protein
MKLEITRYSPVLVFVTVVAAVAEPAQASHTIAVHASARGRRAIE